MQMRAVFGGVMISLSIESTGLDEMRRGLAELQAMGSAFSGIELKGKTRDDGVNNAEILQYQAEMGRDAISLTDGEAEQVAKSFASELKEALQGKVASKGSVVAAKALKAAMVEYMKIVTRHIESKSGANGKFKPLDPDYVQHKINAIGFDDMLKWTGQLLDNLNPDGTSARNVRLLK